MLKVDYSYSAIKFEEIKKFEKELVEISDNFEKKKCLGSEYIGWYTYVNELEEKTIDKIIKASEVIRNNYDVFVVCGIGGSYLGSRAVIEAIKGLKNYSIEVVYMGNTFDERYIKDMLSYLENKNFCVNVISKSGTTLETAVAFRLIKELLIKKYGSEYKDRVYVTTDKEKGCLKEIADKEGYTRYVIPNDVGGRYSVFTPVGLLPIAVAGIDIKKFINGAKKAFESSKSKCIRENVAYQYAAYRYLKYKKGKSVELFVTYSPYLNMVSEWWKQLFGESEGKDGKGLFPASVNFSTDLHSLGQFVQQGSKILFITQIKVLDRGLLKVKCDKEDVDGLNYLNKFSLGEINLSAQEGTNKAHYSIGGIDNFTFETEIIDEFSLGYLLFILMYSCMLSANLLEVNPFDQPGVEFYKSEMKKILKK